MGVKLTNAQGVTLTYRFCTFAGMGIPDVDEIREAFAERLNLLCDDMGLPDRGRQTHLAKIFGVTNKAARLWLKGLGYPEMTMAVRIAEWAGVNVTWLLQGTGPRSGDRTEDRARVLDEALHALSPEQATDLIDSLRAKLIRIGKLPAEGHANKFANMLADYEKALDRRRH